MTFDSISVPSRTIATAVSSQLVSMPRMRVTVQAAVEHQDTRRHQAVQAAAIRAGLDLAYAAQRRVAQLAQHHPVGGGVQDARVVRVSQVQPAGTIWRDGADRRHWAIRRLDAERQFGALAVETMQRPVVHAQVDLVALLARRPGRPGRRPGRAPSCRRATDAADRRAPGSTRGTPASARAPLSSTNR